MHEFSLAQNIFEQATQLAEEHGFQRITAVKIRVGEFCGVESAILLDCWDILRDGKLADSILLIENIRVSLFCPFCQKTVNPENAWNLRCPECLESSSEMRSGRELEFDSLEGI